VVASVRQCSHSIVKKVWEGFVEVEEVTVELGQGPKATMVDKGGWAVSSPQGQQWRMAAMREVSREQDKGGSEGPHRGVGSRT
jgi:hypothetical protein